MPRQLPPVPNLAHLKKQAKRLQQQQSESTLSQAQFAIAKSYGFRSWSRLKTHVESFAPDILNRRLAGAWSADLANSTLPAPSQFLPTTVHFAVKGDSVTVTHIALDASARQSRGTYTMLADGRAHPRGTSGYVAVAKWINSLTLVLTEKNGDEVLVEWRFQLSADARALAMTLNGGARLVLKRDGEPAARQDRSTSSPEGSSPNSGVSFD